MELFSDLSVVDDFSDRKKISPDLSVVDDFSDRKKIPLGNKGKLYFECPWCGGTVEIMNTQINCGIFRHATYKTSGQQIPPHASRDECERLIDQVFGCAKPFQISCIDSSLVIKECDYI